MLPFRIELKSATLDRFPRSYPIAIFVLFLGEFRPNDAAPVKTGRFRLQAPYVDYEVDPLWPLIEKGIVDLVKNQDLVEKCGEGRSQHLYDEL